MSEFFLSLLKRTDRKEDTFTECLAETLRQDPDLMRDFVTTLCGAAVGDVPILPAHLSGRLSRTLAPGPVVGPGLSLSRTVLPVERPLGECRDHSGPSHPADPGRDEPAPAAVTLPDIAWPETG